ncbi:hypothetical protein [Nostoc sp. LPT]|uniref:hypothetical protein n=1 Tax=Nostoc sp. LPT TaxID=2815387 RepID=UPI0025CC932C|nr:hypothetical protein [Nostoc sp. LPT]
MNTERLDCLRDFLGAIGRAGVGESYISTFSCQTLNDGGPDTATASGDECAFIFECVVHIQYRGLKIG